MANISHLRKRLKALVMFWQEVEPETVQEEKQRQALHDRNLFTIECEEWRLAVRVTFQLMTTRRIKEQTEAGEIEKIRTVFNWEKMRDELLTHIDQRELNAINHYNNQLKSNGQEKAV